MLSLRNTDRIFLYRYVTDMRKGFDGLSGLVTNTMKMDVLSGDIYVFINRSRNLIKLLRYEKGGFSIYYKRLEEGSMALPIFKAAAKSKLISSTHLLMIIEGISLEKRIENKRYNHRF